jgi:hypothetical protein
MDLLDNVYIGIGSAPHCSFEQYTDRNNQMFPKFVREMGGNWTLINVDPMFDRENLVDKYFTSLGFIRSDYNQYSNKNTDAIFLLQYMEDEQRNVFLIDIMKRVIAEKKRLVVQQYTGSELIPTFERILKLFPNDQEYIRNNILWDITYGRDCCCMTDMSVWKPILTDTGFFNLACMTDDEIVAQVGKDPRIDELISFKFKTEYRRLINVHHVNYRRRVKGMDNYTKTPEYTSNATPEEIMMIFSCLLYPVMKVLKRVSEISEEKYAQQMDMVNNYHLHDVYKWYSFMCGIYD